MFAEPSTVIFDADKVMEHITKKGVRLTMANIDELGDIFFNEHANIREELEAVYSKLGYDADASKELASLTFSANGWYGY